MLIVACGPSEEEIQARIDNAVEQAIENIESNTTLLPTSTSTTIFELDMYKRAWCITESQEILNFYSNRNSYFGFRPNSLNTVKDVFTYISEVGGNEDFYKGITQLASSGLALFTVSDLLNGYIFGDEDSLIRFKGELETKQFTFADEVCNVWFETVDSN